MDDGNYKSAFSEERFARPCKESFKSIRLCLPLPPTGNGFSCHFLQLAVLFCINIFESHAK